MFDGFYFEGTSNTASSEKNSSESILKKRKVMLDQAKEQTGVLKKSRNAIQNLNKVSPKQAN